MAVDNTQPMLPQCHHSAVLVQDDIAWQLLGIFGEALRSVIHPRTAFRLRQFLDVITLPSLPPTVTAALAILPCVNAIEINSNGFCAAVCVLSIICLNETVGTEGPCVVKNSPRVVLPKLIELWLPNLGEIDFDLHNYIYLKLRVYFIRDIPDKKKGIQLYAIFPLAILFARVAPFLRVPGVGLLKRAHLQPLLPIGGEQWDWIWPHISICGHGALGHSPEHGQQGDGEFPVYRCCLRLLRGAQEAA